MAVSSSLPQASPAAHCGELGLGLLQALVADAADNVCISPICLALTLLLAADGAAGATRDELALLLGVAPEPQRLCDHGSTLKAILATSAGKAHIDVANAVFVGAGTTLEAGFIERAARCFGAYAAALDEPARAAGTINAWVREQTAGRIADLMPGGQDPTAVACVLVSAVYFKAAWQQPMDPSLTREGLFNAPAAPRRVLFMRNTGPYRYAETAEFQAVMLDFGGGALGLDVVLPREGLRLHDAIAALRSDRWTISGERVQERLVEIVLPRCDVTYAADLRPAFPALGAARAFTQDADFSAMGLQGHFVGRMQHEVRLRLDEQGAEAVAASAAVMIRSLAKPVRMCVDRPFLYAIRERKTGCPLFVGAMFEPTAWMGQEEGA